MDSNNNVKNNEIDIRDIARFLLGKLWIIALVVICFAIIAFVYTSYFVTPKYSSTTDMLIVNDSGSTNITSNMTGGQQLTYASPYIITGDFCDDVAEKLNKNDFPMDTILGKEAKDYDFLTKFGGIVGEMISGGQIRSYISVSGNEDSPLVSVTATTVNPELSAVISNAVLYYYEDYVKNLMGEKVENEDGDVIEVIPNENIKTDIYSKGRISNNPSNISLTKNIFIAALIGAVLVCAILVAIFIFDDKIKTPDDIQKHLGLSVLGAIPEIDEA